MMGFLDPRRFLKATGLLPIVRGLRDRLSPAMRAKAAAMHAQVDEYLAVLGQDFPLRLGNADPGRRALVMGYHDLGIATTQMPMIAALKMAGFSVRVLMPQPWAPTERLYRLFGADSVCFYLDRIAEGTHPAARAAIAACLDAKALMAIRHRQAAVGTYALSTLMRRLRKGDISPQDPVLRPVLTDALSQSMHSAEAMERIFDEYAPQVVSFIDRGYTPDGQLFDITLAKGARAYTLNAGHRNDMVMTKRYVLDNRGQHHASLSPESWKALRDMVWTPAHWQRLYAELRGCYESGEWYCEVGTQFDKKIQEKDQVIRELGLDPNKKTAILFAHIFWDATFFWGTDIFESYEDWFCQVLTAAKKNDKLNWIIKVHPANAVKDKRDGYSGEHNEISAIKRTLGSLPDHIKVLPADSGLSTFSLFSVMDYCLTVRGTVGLESACFGARVLTAGTGRYDGLGFTTDFVDVPTYLQQLEDLQNLPPPPPDVVELAQRFTYGLLFGRPLRLTSLSIVNQKDATASLRIVFKFPFGQDPSQASDLKALSRFILAGEEDYLDRENALDWCA